MSILPVNLFQRIANGGGAFAAVGPPAGFPAPNSPVFFGPQGNALVLWFDGNFNSGSDGSDGSRPTLWTDRSGNGHHMSNQGDFNCQLRTITANGAAPSGAHTIQMDGHDSPFRTYIGSTLGPNPWPSITNGYSFYWTFKQLVTPSSSGLAMLFDEASSSDLRLVPRDTGGLYGWRDHAGVEYISTTPVVLNVWRSGRFIMHTDSSQEYILDGVNVTWSGAPPTWTLTPNIDSNFVLGQLQSNNVTGFAGFIQTFLWYNVAHTSAQQRLVDDYMRFLAGMSLL